jgi:Lambda phage tail tube protein, TTP
MTTSAYSSQGAVLSIGTGAGSPVSATSVTVGNPTQIGATAHGFNNGDRVTLSGFTGANAADLNGITFTVIFKETNSFAVAVDSTGHTITLGSGLATPVTFSSIKNTRNVNGFDGVAAELDASNLASTAKEFLLGLVDPGHVTFECDDDSTDAGQISLAAHRAASSIANFKYVLNNGTTDTYTFNAFVKKFAMTSAVDQIVKRQAELRISGSVTKTP